MKVLCVEGNSLSRWALLSLWEDLRLPWKAVGFASGGEALSWIGSNEPVLALLDTRLPDMSGLDLARKLRERWADVPILFVTTDPSCAVDAFTVHASAYLLKPVSLEQLAAEVEYALARRPQEQGRIRVQTFGGFLVQVDGESVHFHRSRAKELLAYLVDRQGSSVTRAQLFAALWEGDTYNRSMQKQLDVIIRSLRDTLREYGIEEILETQGGSIRIVPSLIDCDFYRFLRGEPGAVRAFRGEYMSSYSWASITEASMTQRLHIGEGQ